MNKEIRIVRKPISLEELVAIASESFGDMVKAVVDLEKKIMAIGGELHADEESVLLEQGSGQQNVWGINIYVEQPRESWIEFDSMINIRPSQNNRTRSIEDQMIRDQIVSIVDELIL